MFPRDFYEILHILGIALIFTALGGVYVHAASGASKRSISLRPLVLSAHGLGSVLILVGGFGMLARMGFMHGANFPGWLWGKIVMWLLLSAAIALPYRSPAAARVLLLVLPLVAAVAAWLALYKPF